MDEEKNVPLVESLPNGSKPTPDMSVMPEGSQAHPGEHLEHDNPGFTQKVEIKDPEDAGSWRAKLLKHGIPIFGRK